MKLFPRSVIAAALFLAFTSSNAQVNVSTYYVIPPTNGCDGLWAFGPYSALWQNCGTAPYMWLFEPITCVDSGAGIPVPLNVVGDTVIMDLCSLPCDFELYSADSAGPCLVCSTLPPLQVVDRDPGIHLLGPNPVPSNDPFLRLRSADDRTYRALVLDAVGKTHLDLMLGRAHGMLDLHGIARGSYLLLLIDDMGQVSGHRFQIE